MDYTVTYLSIYIRFYVSDMILLVDSDTAYLVMPKVKSRIAGYFQLNDYSKRVPYPKLNRAILVECKTLKHIVLLATEAKTVGIFHNT